MPASWITDSNLGSIDVGEESSFEIKAEFSQDLTVLYQTNDPLPPGLNLEINGKITGKLVQIPGYEITGLTTIDGGFTTFDSDSTKYDHTFIFSVIAEGTHTRTTIQKEFFIQINSIVYVNVIGKAFLTSNQRTIWNNFINDEKIFAEKYLYKPSDKNYGLHKELSLLVQAGVRKEISEKFVSLIGLHNKRKRFYFGNVKVAQAIIPNTRTVEYEVVYVEVLDPLEPNDKILPEKIKIYPNLNQRLNSDNNCNIFWTRDIEELLMQNPFNDRPDFEVDAGKSSYLVSDPDTNLYYVNSINNWRNQFSTWRDDNGDQFLVERNCLPQWMRSIQYQNNDYQELGYIPAIVLCYCKPNLGKKVIDNINNFDFNRLDFIIDRYIIVDKYVHFKNKQNII